MPPVCTRRFPFAHKTACGFILATICIVYSCKVYNVLEYLMATPFAYFEYPLEVDMNMVVDSVLNRVNPGVQPVNTLKLPYVLNSEKKCRNEDGEEEDIYLLLLIKSKIDNFEERNVIRRTWGRENYDARYQIRRVFILGVNPEDRLIQHRIGMESQDWDDIVQLYFEDSYHNNTHKMVGGFDWVSSFCRRARYLAFLDDDYYVSPYNVIKLVSTIPESEQHRTIIGFIWKNTVPFRIKSSKWYISLEEYPFNRWPPYPTGGSFFMHSDTAHRMYAAMQYTKMFRFDDIYIGIVAWKLGVKLKHSRRIHFEEFTYDKYEYRDVVAAHGFKDLDMLYKIWKEQEEDRRERVSTLSSKTEIFHFAM